MISATLIMLNWKRPAQLSEYIRQYLGDYLFDEIIVWNNNPLEPIELPVTVINPNVDLGMNTRWYAGAMARNNCIFYLDDDIYVPPTSVKQLYRNWERNPLVLHGFHGRRPLEDNTYAKMIDCSDAEVEMVIGKIIVTHISNVIQMLQDIREFSITTDCPKQHGEDIFFSYSVCHHRKSKNRVYKPEAKVTYLPEDEFAVCARPGHAQERTQVMRACREAFGL